MVVPHSDLLTEKDRWHRFASVRIAKKTYDHIFCLESAPPKVWLESCASLWWIPMVEFTWSSHIEELDPSVNVLWHSRCGFDAATRLRRDLNQLYFPFAIERELIAKVPRCVKNKVILHQRARCLNNMQLLNWLTVMENLNFILWTNLGERSDLGLDGRCENVHGQLPHEAWISIADRAGIYVAGRAMEGVGLCVQEAAARGCAIAGPANTVSGEYYPDHHGGITVDLSPVYNPKEPWLVEPMDWSPVDGIDHVKDLAGAIVKAVKDDVVEERGIQAWEHTKALADEFETNALSILSNLKPRSIVFFPKVRRRILSIQTVAWGGQGLFELWVNQNLSKHFHLSLFSCRLWTQNFSKKEGNEHVRIMEDSSVRLVAPEFDDLRSVDPEFVFVHWSDGCERLADPGDMASIMRFLNETKAHIIVWAHNVAPVPEWLCSIAYRVLYPSRAAFEAARRYEEMEAMRKSPRLMDYMIHFINKELDEQVCDDLMEDGTFRVGIIGRVTWTKFDPSYLSALESFMDAHSQARVLWLGSSSEGHFEGLPFFNGDRVEFREEYGRDRFSVIRTMKVALFLSAVQESFGMAAVEAALVGVPVITNRREIKENLGAAAVLVRSPSELSLVFDRMVRDASFYRSMKEATKKVTGFDYGVWEARLFDMMMRAKAYDKPEWSVLVRAYEVEEYLPHALASAVANDADEVVVVVSPSKDGTLRVARDWEARYPQVRVVDLELRAQPGEAMSIGFAHCTRDLVAILDADDQLVPGALQRMTKVYRDNTRVVFAWSDHFVMQGDELMDISFSSGLEGDSILDDVCAGKNVVSHLLTMKRSAAEFYRHDEANRASSDKDLAFQMEELGEVMFVPERLYVYRWRRGGSMTHEAPEAQQEGCRSAIERAKVRRAKRAVSVSRPS